MAKATMGRAKFKIQRRFGVELPGLGKAGALDRRPYGPGQHGMKRKKLSDYTVRLMEKQKLMFHYGLREGQLRNYVKKCKKDKSRAWIETLIIGLESRLDSVVFRLGLAPSIPAARQMVSHGHIRINGVKKDLPAITLKPGDKVTLTAKGLGSGNYLQAKAKPRLMVPAFLKKETDGDKDYGVMLAHPLAEDIPFEFKGQLITEYYWKI